MKIIQLIKKVNNTEIGAATTHETYVLVTQGMEVGDIFNETGRVYEFTDKILGKRVAARLTVGREKRIVGLGPFYRDHFISAGDEVVFEKREGFDSHDSYFISVNKFNNRIILQKNTKGFEILTPDRLTLIKPDTEIVFEEKRQSISVRFLLAANKRVDSPEKTNFYSVEIGGESIGDDYKNGDTLELEIADNLVRFCKEQTWKKYVFELEEL